ncbi:MAG: copper homeostasis protein CutC [Bacteroidetes bacterium]|nr:copper homeostasis protein CutC [Bacteroidota bacterium]MDA1345452.1 copper homeostasis protein CutC [Bacteroidota bacterium]
MQVEVCATSLLSVRNAAAAGADRVELCDAYSLGGLTPSFGLTKAAVDEQSVEVHCLIRSRAGHFCFDSEEIEVMKHDVAMARQLGAHGVVLGALTPDLKLDIDALETLIAVAGSMALSFHRAFDLIADPQAAMTTLYQMGIRRILSSGGAATAPMGMQQLMDWQAKAPQGLYFQPGSGINASNCMAFKTAGFSCIHLSGYQEVSPMVFDGLEEDQNPFVGQTIGHSDLGKIKAVVDQVSR